MKRTITSIVAALAIISGLTSSAIASPPPVPPAGLGCGSLINDLSSYPRNGYYYFCGAAGDVATWRNPSASVWGTIPSVIKTKLQNTSSYLIIFKNRTDAETYYGVSLTGLSGVTIKDTASGAFNYQVSSTWITNGWTLAPAILVHERGHALDNAYGSASQNLSSQFHAKVNLDWTYINSLTRAQMFLRGVPNKKYNPATQTWTNYNPGTKTNKQILVDLFPWLFDGSADANDELYPHLYQQYENQWNNDCPYSFVPQSGGGTTNYLEWQEVFGKFLNVTQKASGKYFHKMYFDNANFTP